VKKLEEELGERLFEKQGRRLTLTGIGRVVYDYADQIFSLGAELSSAVREGSTTRRPRLVIGVADSVPKLIVRELLKPARSAIPDLMLACREGSTSRLLADVASHSLDAFLSDAPVPGDSAVRVFNHLLGESDVSIYATPELAEQFKRKFPRCLNGAPFLLPSEGTSLRRSLDPWFEQHEVKPNIIAEFDDTALMKAFGEDGAGLFVSPSAIANTIVKQYGVVEVGRLEGVRERFYVVSPERRLKHPAIVAVQQAAKLELF
jgi:LysR family transcriptional activator of nhaA